MGKVFCGRDDRAKLVGARKREEHEHLHTHNSMVATRCIGECGTCSAPGTPALVVKLRQ